MIPAFPNTHCLWKGKPSKANTFEHLRLKPKKLHSSLCITQQNSKMADIKPSLAGKLFSNLTEIYNTMQTQNGPKIRITKNAFSLRFNCQNENTSDGNY